MGEIRYTLKDNFATKSGNPRFGNESTTFALNCSYDSTVKTLMDEAGHNYCGYSLGTPFACGNIDNRFQIDGINAGGSSSGTARDVKDDKVDVGICSDVGGSARIPASRAGLIGYKASTDEVPRRGMYRACSSMEGVGWISKTIKNSKDTLKVLSSNADKMWKNIRVIDTKHKILEDIGAAWLSQYLPQFYSNTLCFNGVFHKSHPKDFVKEYQRNSPKECRKTIPTLVKSRIFAGGRLAMTHDDRRRKAFLNYVKILSEEFPSDELLITPAEPDTVTKYDQYDDRFLLLANILDRPSIVLPLGKKGVQLIGPKGTGLKLHDFAEKLINKYQLYESKFEELDFFDTKLE